MDRRRIVAIVIAGIAILGACAILPAASGTGHSPGISAPASSKASDPVAPPATPEVAQPTGGAHSHPAAPIHPDITSIITILPNGTLSPATAFISQSGNTYTVVSAFNGGIIDERNGSTVDGAGLTLTTGSGDSTTVEVLGASSVTIEDLVVSGSSTDYAFWVYGSSNVKIIGCNATLAVDAGIDVHDSDTVNLLHDNTSGSGATEAIETYYTSNVLAANNNVSGSEYGVDLEDGNNVTSEHNTAVGDTIPFYLYLDTDVLELGNTAWATTQDVFDTNILSHFAFRWNNASGGGQEGISLEEGGTDGAITHNSFKGTFTKYGVYLSQSDSVNVTDNDLAIGGGGVYAEYANSVGVSSNNVSGDDDGVDIQYSSGINVSFNDASQSTADGVLAQDSSGIGIFDNNVSGAANAAVSTSDSGGFSVVDNYGFNAATYGYYDDDSNAFSILGNNFSGATGEGAIYLGGYETNVVIQDNQATVSEDGLYMYYVEGGQVDGNDFSGALDYALYLYYVTDVRFDPDNISSSGGEGVYLYESDEVSFVGTIALNEVEEAFDIENSVDVSVVNSVGSSATNDGMYLYEDADVFLSNDNVSNSDIGLYLSSNGNVTVVGCTLYADTNIFELAGGGANLLYHNNFIDVTGDLGWVNQNQPGSMFTWDDGYAVGGNYWNNHTSPDIERGPGQNIPAPSGDGIVDTPVVINATNIDHYPLTTPWKSPTITFLETGLPVGTPWTVVVNGTTVTSTTAAAVYAQANGAYSQYDYSVSPVAGYNATPSSGTSAPIHSNPVITITFTTVSYSVTFNEAGLATGTGWTVTLGTNTSTSTTSSLVFSVPSGSYLFTVHSVPNYALSGGSGTADVVSGPVTESVTFSLVTYTITFTETGLSSGTSWSVMLGGTPVSSTTSTISFTESNGSYSYTVGGASGYTGTPSSGNQAISGGGASIAVVFTSTSTTSISSALYDGLVIGLIVLAIVAALLAVLWMRSRRSKPSPTSWTPPGGSAGSPAPPPPAGGGATPPPGASGGT